MEPLTQLIVLALAWMLYGVIHSVLASTACKTWFRTRYPQGFRGYRLGFNLASLVLLVPPLWLLFSYTGDALWHWPPPLAWVLNGAAIAAIAGFVATLGSYDSSEFFGFRQLADSAAPIVDQAPMSLSWAHRFVRHPWYFFSLVVIWTREMNAALLVSAVLLTLYLVIGSRLEENKLVELYGTAYRRYMQRVPGLVPLPGRYLRSHQIREILDSSRT